MTRWVLSSLVLPVSADEKEFAFEGKAITLNKAREWVKSGEFVSAVGHESTAKALTELLGVEIKLNRIFATMEVGDEALCTQFLVRLREGQVLTKEELEKLFEEGKIRFVLLRRTK